MKNLFLSAFFFVTLGSSAAFAQSGQMLTASADMPGVQQHSLFTARPANFFIYNYSNNPNGQIDYITDPNHNHTHEHMITGTLKRYSYALAPNMTPANDSQIITQYANMITSRGGTVYTSDLSGARMEVVANGVNNYILVVPSGGGTQFEIIVFEYDPNQQ
jgi:hypothetical protein